MHSKPNLYRIQYCPLHLAAPDIYEACKEMLKELKQTRGISLGWLLKWEDVIAKVEELK